MATKSFQTDFKLSKKASYSFASAMEKSRKVSHEIKQPVRNVKNQSDVNKLMDSFLRK